MFAMDCVLSLRSAASKALAHEPGSVSRGSEVNFLNVEADGSVLYCFKTRHYARQISREKVCIIALHDARSKENKVLHALEGGGDVLSASVNSRHTLLAFVTVAAAAPECGDDPAGTAPRVPAERRGSTEEPDGGVCPGARAFVLEMPGERPRELRVPGTSRPQLWTQFLYDCCGGGGGVDDHAQESHLLLTSDTGRVDLFHVRPSSTESAQGPGGVFVMRSGGGAACDGVVCRFVVDKASDTGSRAPCEEVLPSCGWSQWDPRGQRLFYLLLPTEQEGGGGGAAPTLRCLQFYPDRLYQLMLVLPLPQVAWGPDRGFVNAGALTEPASEFPSLRVVSGKSGTLCVCYQEQPAQTSVRYSILMVHHGRSFTFEVEAGDEDFQRELLLFTHLDGFVAVSLPGRFLHLVNMEYPWLSCHSLFLEGGDLSQFLRNYVTAPDLRALGDAYASRSAGTLHRLGPRGPTGSTLGATLRRCQKSGHRTAFVHAALASGKRRGAREQILRFLRRFSREPTTVLLQEFLVLSVLGEMAAREAAADAIPFLPYTSLAEWTEETPGVTMTQEAVPDAAAALQRKASGPGFWSGLERRAAVRDAGGRRYRLGGGNHAAAREIIAAHAAPGRHSPRAEELLSLARRVLSLSASWSQGGRGSLPLFQEEDLEQMLLAGMLVDGLRSHLHACLPALGKRALEDIALSYVQIQLQQVTHLLESVWAACGLSWDTVNVTSRAAWPEASVLLVLMQLADAATQLSLPLPSGMSGVQCMLGFRSMPLHSFLLAVSQGTLRLTDSFVLPLFKDLDDSPKNEQLKFSILSRLTQRQSERVYQVWEHPAVSFRLAQRYAASLYTNGHWAKRRQGVRDPAKSSQNSFLPLRSFINYLLDMEEEVAEQGQGVPGGIDARFVEDVVQKQMEASARQRLPR